MSEPTERSDPSTIGTIHLWPQLPPPPEDLPAPEPITRPYVLAAFVCEKVLREGDGSLTPIRITEQVRINYNIPLRLSTEDAEKLLEEGPPLRSDALTLVIMVRGPAADSEHKLRLVLDHVGHGRMEYGRADFYLVKPPKGEFFSGANLTLDLILTTRNPEGDLWIEIYVDDVLASRVPFTFTQFVGVLPLRSTPESGHSPDPEATQTDR